MLVVFYDLTSGESLPVEPPEAELGLSSHCAPETTSVKILDSGPLREHESTMLAVTDL